MEAAQDDAVALCVQQGQGKALVATRVLEGVESNQPDLLEGSLPIRFEYRRSGGDVVELGRHRIDLVEVRIEDRLETPATLATGDSLDPVAEPADAPGLDDDDQQQDENGECERADDSADVGFDERVQVDGRAPPAGTAGV